LDRALRLLAAGVHARRRAQLDMRRVFPTPNKFLAKPGFNPSRGRGSLGPVEPEAA